MNRLSKTILLILTLWPALYIFLFFAFFFQQIFTASLGQGSAMPAAFNIIFVLHTFTAFLSFALIIYYLVHLYQNKQILGNGKMLWTIAFFFGNVVTMLLYWLLHIQPSKKPRTYKPAPNKA